MFLAEILLSRSRLLIVNKFILINFILMYKEYIDYRPMICVRVCVYRRIQYVERVFRRTIQITYLLTIRPMFSAIYRVVVINYEYGII